jgi:FKBP-type peptidyl-prolyl cis-trans isomerase
VKGRGIVQAKIGYIIGVHYTGKLGDGAAFCISTAGELLEFTIGDEQH